MKTEKTSGVLGAMARNPLTTAGVALAGASAVRGAIHAGPHEDQARNQIETMKHDASAPVRKFAEAWSAKVASHTDRYARNADRQLTKTAAGAPAMPSTFGSSMLHSFGESATKGVANALFAAPINKAFEIIDRKLYLEPKQKNILQQVIQSDPIIAKAMQETPVIVMDAYKTLKQYAPSLTVDTNALKNFLRQAVVMGGQIDFATIKLLAETEKNVRQSRGQIGAHG